MNNAGRSQRALFEAIDIEVDRDIFENNVFGGLNLSRILTRHWFQQNCPGHIVVTSSIVGKTALSNCSSYTASKHALHVSSHFSWVFLHLMILLGFSLDFLQYCMIQHVNNLMINISFLRVIMRA